MSYVSDKWRCRHRLHDHEVCLALEGTMKYQVQQLNKIGVAAMTTGSDEEAEKNGKVRDCV